MLFRSSFLPAPWKLQFEFLENFLKMKEGGYDESFYDDLLNIELSVPCNSWDDEAYCLKCFGPTWREQNVL